MAAQEDFEAGILRTGADPVGTRGVLLFWQVKNQKEAYE